MRSRPEIRSGLSCRNLLCTLTAAAGIMLTSSPACSLDAGLHPADYVVRAWGIGEGLPQNGVTAVAQTADGYIWLGTYSGLARFDGVDFRLYNRWNTPGLISDRITALLAGEEGELWVGTNGGGLSRLEDGRCTHYTSREGLSSDYVTCLLRDPAGALWAGTEDGLNRLYGDEIASFTTWHGLGGNSISSLAPDGRGGLLIGTLDGGVSLLEDPGAREFKPYPAVPARGVSAMAMGGDGRLWVAASKGLYVVEEGTARLLSREDGLPGSPVSAVLAPGNGDVYAGLLAGGLAVIRGAEVISLTRENDFPDSPVYGLLMDRDGCVWAATGTSGLVQVKDPVVRTITARHGLTGERVTSVLYDRRGDLWVGTAENGLCVLRAGRVARVFDTATGLPSGRISSLLEDSAGSIWVGTEGGGLCRVRDGSIKTYGSGEGLSSDHVTALLEDREGALWIGTARGLCRMREGAIRVYDRAPGLRGAHVRTLFEDGRGVLHVGTRQGLVKFYDESALPLYLNQNGIEPDVLCIHEDSAGALWIGTAGNGLIRYESNEVAVYTTREGLFDDNIFSILEDSRGRLYMSSYVGVFSVSLEELQALRDGGPGRLTPALYDETEGFRNRQCAMEGEPAACICPDGRLYFATIDGLAVLDPRMPAAKAAPPSALIESVTADNEPVPAENPRISEGVHVLQFEFTALDFTAPDKLRFEYRLRGYDREWNPLGFRNPRTAYYFNLGPGEYAFEVRAAGNSGVWGEPGAAFAFRIAGPFYERPRFYVPIVMGVAVAGAALYLLRRRKAPEKPPKYSTSAFPEERTEEVLSRLKRLMEEEKVYLDADLNLQELARRVGIHYNYLSRVINEKLGMNYNDYVNRYRIEEAQRRLADPAQADRTILDIAYDTGFYSKSVFNTAFKAVTGTTPSLYRKKRSGQGAGEGSGDRTGPAAGEGPANGAGQRPGQGPRKKD